VAVVVAFLAAAMVGMALVVLVGVLGRWEPCLLMGDPDLVMAVAVAVQLN
jgi:hypothetical protein